MKIKLLSIAVLLAVFTTTAFSQKVHLGLKAGTDLFKITGKSFDEEFNFGFHIGGFAEFKLKKIGIQPEIYFSEVSTDTKTGSSLRDVYHVDDVKFGYLNIPILANIYFSQNVAIQLGPQFGILIKQDDITENGSFGNAVNDAFKTGDFSLTGGLQIKLGNFRLYGRYVIGLNDKNDLPEAFNDQSSWKSQTVHLGLAWAIL